MPLFDNLKFGNEDDGRNKIFTSNTLRVLQNVPMNPFVSNGFMPEEELSIGYGSDDIQSQIDVPSPNYAKIASNAINNKMFGATSSTEKTSVEGNGDQESNPQLNVPQNNKGNQFGFGVGNNMGLFASMLGESVGNARSGKGGAGNTTQGVTAGLGLASSILGQGLNLFRTGRSASATAQRNNWVEQEQRKKMADARQGQMAYLAEGGSVVNNETRIVPIVGASGEYVAPKKGETNVVVEEGENIQIPGDPLSKEALGERHEDGGTPTNLPSGTAILSDRRKLSEKQASVIRDRFNIKVTPKMTYSEVQSKYKNKIGLSDALDEMDKLTKKLEDNNKNVKDKNTARLNASIISKHMGEVQKNIDALSQQDKSFFDVLFDMQEQDKRGELEDYYFGEGGTVDKEEFNKSLKQFGLTEEQGRKIVIDRMMKGEFADGGRYMEFVPVYNKYRTEDETYGDKGYQALINGSYGRVSEWGSDAIAEMARLFPRLARGEGRVINIENGKASWVDPSNTVGNARAIENVVNGVYGGLNSLSDLIVNYSDARNNLMYGFSSPSEKGPVPPNSSAYAHNERTGEGKLGEYHMSRSGAGLRVVTPEQLKQLNDAGIRNYSDLFDNENTAKSILKDDFNKLADLRNREGASDLDFVIMDYTPALKPLSSGDINVPKAVDKDLSPIGQKTVTGEVPVKKEEEDKGKPSVGRTVEGMPWLFGDWSASTPPPSSIDPSYLNQVRAMRSEPVLRSADQMISAIDQTTNAQIRSLDDLADSQRGAYLSSIGAQANEAKARAISDIDLFNAEQRNRASELNEQRYMQVDMANAELREKYEDKVLQNKAASEDAWFSYWQNMRDQQLVNDEARIKANILSNIYPNVDIYGNSVGGFNFSVGPNVSAAKQREEQELAATKKKGSSTTTKKK